MAALPARGPRAALLAPILLPFLLPAGCKLVDQRTFDPKAGRPPMAAKPAAPPPAPQPDRALDERQPLLTIRVGQDTGYEAAIRQAARAVLARKPDAQFTVLTAIPPGSADAQAQEVEAIAPEAARVGMLIGRSGVPASRVRLAARPEPDLGAPELRVYAR